MYLQKSVGQLLQKQGVQDAEDNLIFNHFLTL